MNILIKKILSVFALFALVASLTACGRTAPIKDYESIPVPSNITSDAQVKKAIKLAGASLGWIISDDGDHKLKGTLNLRNFQAVISIPYSNKDYNLSYVSSENLKYNSTDRTIHKNYNGWISNLNNKIQFYLTTSSQ